MLNLSQTARDPHIIREALFALVNFHGPALVRTTLELACSGRVRNQDSAALIARVLEERQSREIAWEYIRDNWEKIKAQLTTSNGSRLVAATGAFCSVSARDQVSDFFSKNRVNAVDRALKRATDYIDECVELVDAQQAKLHAWLSQHSAAAGVSAQ